MGIVGCGESGRRSCALIGGFVVGRRGLSLLVVAGAMTAGALFFGVRPALAAATVTVVPATGLKNGDVVMVSASGFFNDGPVGIMECSSATPQPTIRVAGTDLPVSCTNPANPGAVQNLVAGGLSPTPLTIRTGTLGPPATGVDSDGKDAAADAALFPCPPTDDQVGKGAKCIIAIGNAQKETARQEVAIQGTVTTIPPATSPTPARSTAATAAALTVAPTTAVPTTVPTAVLGTQFSQTPAAGTPPPDLAVTGPGTLVAALAVAGVVVLDLGYLFESSTRASRPSCRREGVVPGV
jgi:hypothetical protein